jgi:predicted amidophosphoribosyltransferase
MTRFERLRLAGRRLLYPFLQLVFPSSCRLCSADLVDMAETVLCQPCRDRIGRDRSPACPQCGRYLEQPLAACGHCTLAPPPYERHVSYAAYGGDLKEVILLYKYQHVHGLRHLLAQRLADLVQEEFAGMAFDLVLAVPEDRGRRRPYAPMAEVARELAHRLRVPLARRLLVKRRPTAAQAGLGLPARLQNLRGAFVVRNNRSLRGLTLLLLDDVFTTGSTMRYCAAALHRRGARVYAATVAQTRQGE